MSQPKYLWLDLETTGLEPIEHHILEFAVIVTGADLRPIEQAGGVLKFDIAKHLEPFGGANIDEFVREMHTKNGLWAACKNGLSTPASMEAFLLGLVTDCAPWVNGKPILAGSSPHFDRGFLRAWCPKLSRALHYRHFDVSTLKMANDYGDGYAIEDAKPGNHRASSDLESSLDFARRFVNYVHEF